jgi:hypothetical protein
MRTSSIVTFDRPESWTNVHHGRCCELDARLAQLERQLQQARAELRTNLWRADAEALAAVQAIERDVERLICSASCGSTDALELAIFRMRGIAAALA